MYSNIAFASSTRVFRVAADEHVLLVAMHPIAADAWSLDLACPGSCGRMRGPLCGPGTRIRTVTAAD
jgi:hypothetical protein